MNKDPQDIASVASHIIRSRRSVYPNCYTGDLIDDQVIEMAIKDAIWAPTHRKTEPWRFLVYRRSSFGPVKAAMDQSFLRQDKEKYNPIKHKKNLAKLDTTSHLIAIIMQRDEQERLPEWEEIAAVSCAVQNLWLSLSARGMGAYWSSPSWATGRPDFLNLSDGQRSLGLLYVGIPLVDLNLTSKRMDIDEVCQWSS